MRKIFLAALAIVALGSPAFAAEDPASKPKAKTDAEWQQQVDALNQQVQYWQGIARQMQADRNAALDAKADMAGQAFMKAPAQAAPAAPSPAK